MTDSPQSTPPEDVPFDDLVRHWFQYPRSLHREAQDFYFQRILPRLLDKLAEKPEHQALRDEQVHTLVSLMGFSPETTIIAASVIRPEKLVVVLSENTMASYNRAFLFLIGQGILQPGQIDKVVIPPTDTVAIYNEVRDALRRHRGGHSRRAMFDVTGGKKIMSATAGQVAWELEMPLCYVESKAYDEAMRRPLPGGEVVLRLPNPSRQREITSRRDALAIYASRRFIDAVRAFERSRDLRSSNELDELGLDLCRCYAAWIDLNLPDLSRFLALLNERLRQPRIAQLLRERETNPSRREAHLQALGAVANCERLALIATYLELGRLYRDLGRHDFACLLYYRSMEALVEAGLKQLAGEAFSVDMPDYGMFHEHADMETRYAELALAIDPKSKQGGRLPSKIGFINGLMMLCIAAQVHERWSTPMQEVSFVHSMRSQATRRNKSILAHGHNTLGPRDSEEMADCADKLARAILDDGFEALESHRRHLAPLPLQELHDLSENQ